MLSMRKWFNVFICGIFVCLSTFSGEVTGCTSTPLVITDTWSSSTFEGYSIGDIIRYLGENGWQGSFLGFLSGLASGECDQTTKEVDPYFQLSLNRNYYITSVSLKTSSECSYCGAIENMLIEVGDADDWDSNKQTCALVSYTLPWSSTIDINCDTPVYGNSVRFTKITSGEKEAFSSCGFVIQGYIECITSSSVISTASTKVVKVTSQLPPTPTSLYSEQTTMLSTSFNFESSTEMIMPSPLSSEISSLTSTRVQTTSQAIHNLPTATSLEKSLRIASTSASSIQPALTSSSMLLHSSQLSSLTDDLPFSLTMSSSIYSSAVDYMTEQQISVSSSSYSVQITAQSTSFDLPTLMSLASSSALSTTLFKPSPSSSLSLFQLSSTSSSLISLLSPSESLASSPIPFISTTETLSSTSELMTMLPTPATSESSTFVMSSLSSPESVLDLRATVSTSFIISSKPAIASWITSRYSSISSMAYTSSAENAFPSSKTPIIDTSSITMTSSSLHVLSSSSSYGLISSSSSEVFVFSTSIVPVWCKCTCEHFKLIADLTSNNKTNEEVEEEINELIEESTVEKETTAVNSRKYVSAKDERGSAKIVGTVGASFFVGVFALILISDLPILIHIVQKVFRFIKKRVRKIRTPPGPQVPNGVRRPQIVDIIELDAE